MVWVFKSTFGALHRRPLPERGLIHGQWGTISLLLLL
jgi:hypothetical protein